MPVPPDPLPFDPFEQGRPGGGSTLLWPGGPLASPGQGGRGLETLPVTGVGVGWAVGREVGSGVGRDVGRGVGWWVGRGVETAGEGVGLVDTGVGVGATATIGPPVGAADADGSADGAGDGVMDGSNDGATDEGGGSEVLVARSAAVGDAAGDAGMVSEGDGAGVAPTTAMS